MAGSFRGPEYVAAVGGRASAPCVSLGLIRNTCNRFLEYRELSCCVMSEWSFLTNHSRVLLCIAHDPGMRLHDIAITLGITERTAFAIVDDLIAAGYVVKDKEGRRNRYSIQTELPLGESVGRERTIGEVLELLADAQGRSEKAG